MKIVSINGKRVKSDNIVSRKEQMERELYADSFALGMANGLSKCAVVTTSILGGAGVVAGIKNRKAGQVLGGLLSIGFSAIGCAASMRASEITSSLITERAIKCAEAEIDLMEKVEGDKTGVVQ